MTVLRTTQKLKQQPSSPSHRRGPHFILNSAWKIIAASLLLDPLLWSLPHPTLSQTIADSGALICGLITLPFVNQAAMCNRVSVLRKGNKAAVDGKGKRLRGLFVILLLLGVLAKPLMVGRIDNIVALTLVLFLVFGAITSAKHALEKEKAARELFKESPWSHISQWEAQLITILGIPIMLARAVSSFVTLAAGPETPLSAFVAFLVSATLLAMLRPERRFFVGFCQQCKHPVPIVFVDYGSCPLCDERLSPP
jgi:hypothetical protein